jgi:hypothetical protein
MQSFPASGFKEDAKLCVFRHKPHISSTFGTYICFKMSLSVKTYYLCPVHRHVPKPNHNLIKYIHTSPINSKTDAYETSSMNTP